MLSYKSRYNTDNPKISYRIWQEKFNSKLLDTFIKEVFHLKQIFIDNTKTYNLILFLSNNQLYNLQ